MTDFLCALIVLDRKAKRCAPGDVELEDPHESTDPVEEVEATANKAASLRGHHVSATLIVTDATLHGCSNAAQYSLQGMRAIKISAR